MPERSAPKYLRAWPLWLAFALTAAPAQAFFCFNFGSSSGTGQGFPPAPPPPVWFPPAPWPAFAPLPEGATMQAIPASVPAEPDDYQGWRFRPAK
jgi:hypothetical protein